MYKHKPQVKELLIMYIKYLHGIFLPGGYSDELPVTDEMLLPKGYLSKIC